MTKTPDLENLERYYKVNQQHLQWSFWSSLAALGVGLGAVLAGIWITLNGNSSIASHLTTIGGVLTQFIGAGFFFLYSKNLKQLNVFYEKLVKLQDTIYAIGLVGHLPEGRRASTLETIIAMLVTRNEPKSEMTPEQIRAYSEAMRHEVKQET